MTYKELNATFRHPPRLTSITSSGWRKSMRLVRFAYLAVALSFGDVASAAPAESTTPLARLDIKLRNASFLDSVRQVFEKSGKQVIVERGLPEVRLTLTLKDVEPDYAMRLLMRQAVKQIPDLEFEPTAGGYRIFRAAKSATATDEPKPIRFKSRKPLLSRESSESELRQPGALQSGDQEPGAAGFGQGGFGNNAPGAGLYAFGNGQGAGGATYTRRVGWGRMFGAFGGGGVTAVTVPSKNGKGPGKKVWVPHSYAYSFIRTWDPTVTYWSGGVTPRASMGGDDRQFGGGILPKR
ncbi:MAG: hypothetical protein ACO1SX_01905 [Actinomycetota bacterium]